MDDGRVLLALAIAGLTGIGVLQGAARRPVALPRWPGVSEETRRRAGMVKNYGLGVTDGLDLRRQEPRAELASDPDYRAGWDAGWKALSGSDWR